MKNAQFSLSVATALVAIFFHLPAFAKTAAPAAPTKAALSPQANYFISWPLTPAEARQMCDRGLAEAKTALDTLAAKSKTKLTFKDSVGALDEILSRLAEQTITVNLSQKVGATKEVQDASGDCIPRLDRFGAEQWSRVELYNAVKDFLPDADGHTVRPIPDDEATRTEVQEIARNFRSNGVTLPEADRKAHIEDTAQLSRLTTDYTKAAQAAVYFPIKEEWLSDVPANYRAKLVPPKDYKGDAKYLLPLERGKYRYFMNNVPNEEARKAVYVGWYALGGQENLDRVKQAVVIRDRIARRLDAQRYPNFAALAIEPWMAGTPQKVREFLDEFGRRLTPKRDFELAAMRKMKCGNDPNCRIFAWDWRFWSERYKEKFFSMNEAELQKYLTAEAAVRTAFDLYQKLFGLRFERIPLPVTPWADPKTLALYRVRNAKSGKLIGFLYTDLFYRDGKTQNAFQETLKMSRVTGTGAQQPLAYVSADFSLAGPDGKSPTVSHEEVSTFFHELGHAVHALVARPTYGFISGTSVKHDFVEAPSQMLENWTFEPAVLRQINPAIPEELIQAKSKSRYAIEGVFWARQLWLAKGDFMIHSGQGADPLAAFNQAFHETRGFDQPEGTFVPANFGHIMGDGYAAGYYAYIWSRVIAADLYTRFQKEGFDNAATGVEYVKDILAPAGTRDPNVSVEAFLGRPWSQDAFFAPLNEAMKNTNK